MSHPRYAEPTNEEPFRTLRLMLQRDHSIAEFQSYLCSYIEPQKLAGAARYVFDALNYHETLKHTVSVRAHQMGVVQWPWVLPDRRSDFDPASGDESTVLELMVTMYSTIQTVRAHTEWMYDQIEQFGQRQRAAGYFSGRDGNQGGPAHEINGNRRGYSNQGNGNRGGASHRRNRSGRRNWRGSSDQDDSNRAGPSRQINGVQPGPSRQINGIQPGPSRQVNGNQPGPPRQVNGVQPGYSDHGHANGDAAIPGPAASHWTDEHGRRNPGPA